MYAIARWPGKLALCYTPGILTKPQKPLNLPHDYLYKMTLSTATLRLSELDYIAMRITLSCVTAYAMDLNLLKLALAFLMLTWTITNQRLVLSTGTWLNKLFATK